LGEPIACEAQPDTTVDHGFEDEKHLDPPPRPINAPRRLHCLAERLFLRDSSVTVNGDDWGYLGEVRP